MKITKQRYKVINCTCTWWKWHTLYSIMNTELAFKRLFIPSQIQRFKMFHRRSSINVFKNGIPNSTAWKNEWVTK